MIQWEIDIGIGMSSPFSRSESYAGDLPAATPRIHRPTSGWASQWQTSPTDYAMLNILEHLLHRTSSLDIMY